MKWKFKIFKHKDYEEHLKEYVEKKYKLQTEISKQIKIKLQINIRNLFNYSHRPKDKFDKKDIIRILT